MTSTKIAPRFLYKYLSAPGFCVVAKERSFQWSLPTMFNDPFDLQVQIHLGVSDGEARAIIATRLARLALHEEEWIFITPSWGGHPENPHLFSDFCYPREVLREMRSCLVGMGFNEAVAKVAQEYASHVDEILQLIKSYINQITDYHSSGKNHIICFSELHDNILMWAHYGHNHTGVVIEIDTEAKNASPFSRAQSVIYQTECPAFFERKYMRYFMAGDIPRDADRLLYHAARVKSSAWEYEKEWRCMSGMGHSNKYGYSPILPDVVSGVFVGCKTSDAERQRIYRASRKAFPRATVWQGERSEEEYRLEFTAVSSP